MTSQKNRRLSRFLRALFGAVTAATLAGSAFFLLLFLLVPLDPDQVARIDASPALYDSQGRLFHLRLSPNSEWQIPVPLAEMGKVYLWL